MPRYTPGDQCPSANPAPYPANLTARHTFTAQGVNFSLYSRRCAGLELLLFDDVDAAQPARIIPLDPKTNRTFHYWHILVPGLQPGQLYAYRARGPFVPHNGLRFDPAKVLLDPYGKGVAMGKKYSRSEACQPGDNTANAMKSILADPPVRLGRRPAAENPLRQNHHLRAACRRFHQASEFRRGARTARHLCRPGRKDPVPDRAGRHRR
jgi:pullulanase/glycogen debranching enzyme